MYLKYISRDWPLEGTYVCACDYSGWVYVLMVLLFEALKYLELVGFTFRWSDFLLFKAFIFILNHYSEGKVQNKNR